MDTDAASPFAPDAVGGYRQFVEVASGCRLLFVSGQIGQTAEGEVPTPGS
jgi:enamine deaminase RidA (YjgF/YER057c/UK114 family)